MKHLSPWILIGFIPLLGVLGLAACQGQVQPPTPAAEQPAPGPTITLRRLPTLYPTETQITPTRWMTKTYTPDPRYSPTPTNTPTPSITPIPGPAQQLATRVAEMREQNPDQAIAVALAASRVMPGPVSAESLLNTAGMEFTTVLDSGTIAEEDDYRFFWASYNADGSHLLTTNELFGSTPKGMLVVWDLASQKILQRLRAGLGVYSAAESLDGRWYMAASYDGTARVWDAKTGVERYRILHGGDFDRNSVVVFSPYGKWVSLFVTLVDKSEIRYKVRLVEIATGREVYSADALSAGLPVTFSLDERYVLFEGPDNLPWVLDIASSQPLPLPLAEKPNFFFWDSTVYSRDGSRGIAFPTYPPGSFDKPVVVDVASGKILYRAEFSGGIMALSPDGTRLAELIDQEPPGSEKHNFILRVTNVDSGQRIAEGPLELENPAGRVPVQPRWRNPARGAIPALDPLPRGGWTQGQQPVVPALR